MRTSNIQLAEKFSAQEKVRPKLAGIRIENNQILATDSYRAIRITEKISSVSLPEGLHNFFPELSEKKVKIRLYILNQIAEIATKMNKSKKDCCSISFQKDKIIIASDGLSFQEISIANPFELQGIKLDAEYLYSATKELMKKGFEDIFIEQNIDTSPILIVGENEIEKIEIIIMPLR